MNLLKSELRKMLYTRSFYGYTIAASALALLSALPAAYTIVKTQGIITGESLSNSQVVDSIYGKAIAGYLFAILLGVVFMGNEYQSGMAVSTFLATPKRVKVLYAKLGVAAISGVILMVISTSFGLVGAYFGLKHYQHAKPDLGALESLILAAVIAGAVLGVMGVAIGALIRNVRLASIGVVIWLGIVERIIVLFWTSGGKYLPSGLIVGMLNVKVNVKIGGKGGLGIDTANYLGATSATVILLLYATFFAYMGVFISLKRDVN